MKTRQIGKYRVVVPLTSLRHRAGRISQQELSARTGLHQGTLSRLETGKSTGIDFHTLARLCEALRCRPGDLLELEEAVWASPSTALHSIVNLVLDSIVFCEGVLENLEKFHASLEFDPKNPEVYGRYLLIGGALHHLRSSANLLKHGRILSAMSLLRPASECIELCWYMARKGNKAWVDWVKGKGNYNYRVIAKEMAQASVGFNHQVHNLVIRGYTKSSRFVHPTRDKLETLYARLPDGSYQFEPGLAESKQTASAALVLLEVLAEILAFIGSIYNVDWPTRQSREVAIRIECLRKEFNSLLGANVF